MVLLFSQGGFSFEHLSPTCKNTFSISSLQVKEWLVSLGALNHRLLVDDYASSLLWVHLHSLGCFMCQIICLLHDYHLRLCLASSSLIIIYFWKAIYIHMHPMALYIHVWILWFKFLQFSFSFSLSQHFDLCQWTTTLAIESCGGMRGYCGRLLWDIFCQFQSLDSFV